ncbi:hypothetical protein MNBD_GAMMA12-1673 [hydrothermal vent metagenome]|uniref:Uncharacterized protein n=1 Tax=hydrothermal vent metagenome TaxID=652676 RepID=A0A3B0XXI0_9ZZZZ
MDRNHWMNIFSSAAWQQEFEQFLASGGNVSEVCKTEGSALIHYAIDAENYTAINWLVAHGADINAVDTNGWSALHYAVDADIDVAVQTDLDIEFRGARFILSTGADENIKDNSGCTARDVAAKHGTVVLQRYDQLMNSCESS